MIVKCSNTRALTMTNDDFSRLIPYIPEYFHNMQQPHFLPLLSAPQVASYYNEAARQLLSYDYNRFFNPDLRAAIGNIPRNNLNRDATRQRSNRMQETPGNFPVSPVDRPSNLSMQTSRSDHSIDRLLSNPGTPPMPTGLRSCMPPTIPFFTPPHFNVFGQQSLCVPETAMPNRRRRHRTIFGEEQLAVLEKAFCISKYPDIGKREDIASEIDLKEERVEVWFKNRRAKERKKKKEEKGVERSQNEVANHSGSATFEQPQTPTREEDWPNEDEEVIVDSPQKQHTSHQSSGVVEPPNVRKRPLNEPEHISKNSKPKKEP